MFEEIGLISQIKTMADGSVRVTLDLPELNAEKVGTLFTLKSLRAPLRVIIADDEEYVNAQGVK